VLTKFSNSQIPRQPNLFKMKTHSFSFVIVLFAMIPVLLTAQNGGMNVGRLIAATSVTVGTTASETVWVTPQLVALPPLTNSQIHAIVSPQEGMLVYGCDSDVLLLFDGIGWKRLDGTNNHYLPSIPCTGTFTDIDGNSFQGVEIGDQCWMDRNLEVTHYPNGDTIPYITDSVVWVALLNDNSADAYCYYNNTPAGDYGALYSYAAAIADDWTLDNENVINGEGAQGICPDGWHLPTDDEWYVLVTWLSENGHAGAEGTALKSEYGWFEGKNGTDNYHFTALPGGDRSCTSGTFSSASIFGFWWSASEYNSGCAFYRCLRYNIATVHSSNYAKSRGFSVRCVRD